MKLLGISDGVGSYLNTDGVYESVDKIKKEDLLNLVNLTLRDDQIEIDAYDEVAIKNQAQQIIYKSVAQKLLALRARRKEFVDESARLYLDDYERYREEVGRS